VCSPTICRRSERLRERGIETQRPPREVVDDGGIWFHDDDGLLVELPDVP